MKLEIEKDIDATPVVLSLGKREGNKIVLEASACNGTFSQILLTFHDNGLVLRHRFSNGAYFTFDRDEEFKLRIK